MGTISMADCCWGALTSGMFALTGVVKDWLFVCLRNEGSGVQMEDMFRGTVNRDRVCQEVE